ncbi:MAG: CPBP family intramembrane glutamic endopeptidase [Nostoc sp. ChiSLP02]|nr:CPBP family intramembrane glutamic endopeptidase [Nostoc sp. DedSLP05]MDZ8099698.1 CPBP family intramembrane glutamic endopeptidase [Nostoc sp. DedSLP01]MDZ8186045.1 CPBP family intramembrane glutamic endopeptidase [Nostoc sp. ChiSLP02]
MKRHFKKVWLFIGLTFFFNYLLVILYLALGGKWVVPGSSIVTIAYMFIPMIVAVVIQKFIYHEPLQKPLGISFQFNWWFLVAWLLPPTIAFITFAVSLLFPGVEYSPEMAGLFVQLENVLSPEKLQQVKTQIATLPIPLIWISLIQGLIAGVTINAIAAFGEELGWRGLLQKELNFLGFWKSSAIIGLIWGIWHAPIIIQGHNYPQHPLLGVLMMTIFTLLFSPIFSYIRQKSQSVIATSILHGTLNATAGLSVLALKGGNDLTVGVTGLAGFIALITVNICLFLYDNTQSKQSLIK